MFTVLSQPLCAYGMEELKRHGEVYLAEAKDDGYFKALARADCVIVRTDRFDRRAIEHAANLKVIGRTGVGCDNVDLDAANERGIPVVITPGANSRAVAEHTLCVMLALAKNLLPSDAALREGNFGIRDRGRSGELNGKTVGFVGFGNIGKIAASYCCALGMSIAVFDPFIADGLDVGFPYTLYRELDELIARADFVSLHLPLNEKTRGLFDAGRIGRMKDGAFLINAARGGIVDEAALAQALESGKLAGAALDVFETEPPQQGSAIFKAPATVLTPHMAAQTRETVDNMARMAIEGCVETVNGRRWPHVANPRAYEHPRWADKQG